MRMPSWRSIAAKASFTSSSDDAAGDQRVEVEVAGQVAVDELGHAVASLGSAERRAGDPAAGDQVARHHLEHLALAGHARDRARPQPMRADSTAWRITATMPGGLERVVGAEATGHLEDLLDGVRPAQKRVGGDRSRACSRRFSQRSTR